MELHALTLAARSYALLLVRICICNTLAILLKSRPQRSTLYTSNQGLPDVGITSNRAFHEEIFGGFSVGSCINEEEGYLLPT